MLRTSGSHPSSVALSEQNNFAHVGAEWTKGEALAPGKKFLIFHLVKAPGKHITYFQ